VRKTELWWIATVGLWAATGCTPGGVTVDALTPFGTVRSATWLELQGPEQTNHVLILADRGGVCGEVQDMVDQVQVAVDALYPEGAQAEDPPTCPAWREYLGEL